MTTGTIGKVKKYNMRNKVLAAVITAACLFLSSCGFNVSSANTDDAMSLIEQGDYSGALEKLDAAQKSGEDTEMVYRGRGIADMGLADYQGAVKDFETALSANSGQVKTADYDISYYLAVAQFRSGDIQGAADTYSAIIALKPNEASAYFLRGKTELKLEEHDNAIADFNRAVQLDKNDPDMYIQIYESMDECGYKDEGSDYLKEAMELDTRLTDLQKGKIYYCQGEYDKAKEALEKSKTEENEEDVTLYLGRTYEALGDTNYAASLYKTYLEKNPNDVQICNQLGLCCLASGDYQSALTAFEQGLSVPDSEYEQSLRYNQIVAYEYLSNFSQAKVLMESYLTDYPDDTAAQREYTFLKSR